MKALLPLVLLAPIQEARWELHPREALIGEPVRATLLVRTEGAVQAGLEDVELSLGYEWFVLDDGRASTTQAPGEGVSSRTWTVMCLEPGALFWPEVTVPLEGGEVDSILAAPLELEVAPELGQGEDSARPLPGFHAVEERVGPLRAWHALLLAAGVLLLWMFRRLTAKRTVQSATESAPRVESLAPPDTSSPEATVEFAWSLAAALRAAALHTASLHAASLHSAPLRNAAGDLRESLAPGLSDEELAEKLASEALDEDASELLDLLDACTRIKLGGERPTRFAMEELLDRSRVLAGRLARQADGIESATPEEVLR